MHTVFEKHTNKIFNIHYTKSHSFKSHFHSMIEIAYCFSGAQGVEIGESSFTLSEGEAAIAFPGVIHKYDAITEDKGNSTELVVIVGVTELFSELLPFFMTHRPKCPVVKVSSETAKNAFRKLTTAETEAEIAGWTYIVLSEIIKEDNLESVKKLDEFSLAPTLVEYINRNFQKPLTIKFLSKEFGYSESYIAHIFCDRLKIPFRTYLGDVRSEYAANLIKTTGKSLTEIAYDSGYENLNTFCRCFKKRFGVTPSEYRKQEV